MSILGCYGEDLDWNQGTLPTVITTAGHFRAGYARCALRIPTAGSPMRTPTFPARTDAWVTARLYVGNANLNQVVLGLGHATSLKSIGVGVSAASGYYAMRACLYLWDGATFTVLASEPGYSLTGLVKIDLHLQAYGDTGTLTAYVDGVQVVTYTGDLRIAGVTGFDCLLSGPLASGIGGVSDLSEAILADEDTRLFSLVTLAGTGDGDENTFDSGGAAEISEVTLSDASTAYSATPGQTLLMALSDLPSGEFIVKAIGLSARVSDGVGGMAMQIGVKTNGAVHVGDPIALEAAWETARAVLQQNPETVNVFTPAEADALQLAFVSAEA